MKKISASILDLLVREAKNHGDPTNLNAVLSEHKARPILPSTVEKETIQSLNKETENRLEVAGVTVYGK